MKRKPVNCPSCNSEILAKPLLKPRRPATAKEAPVKVEDKAKAKIDDLGDDDITDEATAIADIEDDDDDDALIGDASDLEEEGDIPEITEHADKDLNTDG